MKINTPRLVDLWLRALCRLRGHDWRLSWTETNHATGVSTRHEYCHRCDDRHAQETRARGEA
jgi:hypothetical protein